ncbi:t-SNARE affecting a late Golgi compartment protein 2 [Arthroderma uncinatum]|uniref:t-SNARE affecting a late Golgi compartment protein 2 n=1 Tax=Arthroderma uncinatum TaxID=74035 RepID=UPI00144ABE08|nr:t-SNARE affecting a late Golgi compartment protein 2 [Arthroderma uncinatum]KAF3483638.1 t-SNARE affecting a late Golgi compartment protein 2 [Arthroderma uncinatum]
MWRDRTNLYISYRQSFAHHPAKKPRHIGGAWSDHADSTGLSEERRGLMSGGGFEDDGDAVIEMDLLPPRWMDVQDEVTEYLRDISRKSAQLDKLHQKHVLPGFGDEAARREEEDMIEQLTQDITRGFHDCQRSIQKVEAMARDAREQGSGVNKGEDTMARNLQISLAARVQEASAGFRKKQSTYLKIESDADKSYSQSTLLQAAQQQQQLGSNDAAIAQREREINDIAKGIIELSDIFRDLQTMIIDQGTLLDRIDFNVERMTVDVKGAEKELKVATNYQRRTTKRKILLLLALLVVAMFIILLVKPKKHAAPEPAPQPPPQAPPQNPPPEGQNQPPRRSLPHNYVSFKRGPRRTTSRNSLLIDIWDEPGIPLPS